MTRRLDDLDAAFTLPETVEDVQLRGLYEVLVHRMRKEAENLPMNTVQQLLIERIAYNYIVMRSRERGELGGFVNSNSQKDFNAFWLSMTQEFNRMLSKTETLGGNERKALLREIQQHVLSAINSSVDNPKTRSDLLVNMAAALENVKI